MEFSVIVPALNEESYIGACLESISEQTFPRNGYEIIGLVHFEMHDDRTDQSIIILKFHLNNINVITGIESNLFILSEV